MADVDLDLLASIASGGLGHWEDAPDGSRAYSKDEDCLGTASDKDVLASVSGPQEP